MDGKKRMCTIRGAMRNRVWINAGDIVLIGLRDFGDDAKADIIMKYFDEEAQELQELGELPETIQIAVGGYGIGSDDGSDNEFNDGEDSDGEEPEEEVKKLTSEEIGNI